MAENFVGVTHTGRIRDNNEDTFLAEKLSNGWIVACVIDGVGGYEGGEVAAEIARETIRKQLQTVAADPVQTLREGLLQANQAIYQEKINNKGNSQMACVLTIALVDVESNQFYYAHVGDTRLYLLRDQSLVKLTKDHSFVGFLEDSGRLSEKEAMAHPKRNEINKALGFDPQIDVKSDYIETGSSPFLPGDMLLLCSDGLSDLVDNRAMSSILLSGAPLADKAKALIDAANNAGGKDNITVVIVSNNKKPVRLRATKPVLTKKNERKEPVPVVTPAEKTPEVPVPSKARKRNEIVLFLVVLCFLLAAAVLWLLFRNNAQEKKPVFVAAYSPNDAEKKVADSLGLAQHSLVLTESGFGKSIAVGDTLYVRQDTLLIDGRGVVFRADSAFAGPAFFVTANNKFLSLQNMVFQNFPVALVLQGKGVQLRNVQFLNCKVPVQRQLLLPADSALSGTLRDTFLVTPNSLPK
ncbi:PP2C family protein-serine/threonine phosphatase [Flavisolibacter nicotianae]|uniref:PP2C family protein-serine/threonine phosphatase n=1 Tax=Flavisolibacter nicotianae TaxID=2364882 RepID=UPI000EB4074F|nr:protein phosphatase 2C domain-containing protein [Flavisolibacter nicotianae]